MGLPLIESDGLTLDYSDQGNGSVVVLVHSAVSSNRQWRALIQTLQGSHRLIAPNLFGYGNTTVWPNNQPQSLDAQAKLVHRVTQDLSSPFHLIGHSLGASVALKTASLCAHRIASLCLFEPNPFSLLRQHGERLAWAQACELRDDVIRLGKHQSWELIATRLTGDAWGAMSAHRRAAFIEALPPNQFEWAALMDETATIDDWCAITIPTRVVSDPDTWYPIRRIVQLLKTYCTHWDFQSVPGVGHMAPITRPDLINPLISTFVNQHEPRAHP